MATLLAALAIAVGAVLGMSVLAPAADPADGTESDPATLTVSAGSLLGHPLDSPARDPAVRPTIRWQATEFASPLEFPVDTVARIVFPTPVAAIPGDGPAPWRVDLTIGDSLVGNLASIDGQFVKLAFGDGATRSTIAVDRAKVRRIVRHETSTGFDWDGSLEAWRLSSAEHWKRTPRGIANRRPWATLARSLGDARRFRLDLRLAWSDPPLVRIGVDVREEVPRASIVPPGRGFAVNADLDAGEPRPMPYRIDIDGSEVVAIRDECDDSGKGQADLRICGPTPESGIGLTLFVDQDAGRMVVSHPDGRKPLADLTLPTGPRSAEGKLRIEIGRGEVELQSLRVVPWKGDAFTDDVAVGKALLLRDGSTIAGSAASMVEGADEIAVRTADDGPSRSVPLESVHEIPFAVAAEGAGDRAEAAAGSVRVTDRFGSRLVGTLSRVEAGKVWVAHPAIDGEVGIPLGALVAIESVLPPAMPPPLPGPRGRYVGDAADIEGCLVRLENQGTATIGWLPEGSLTAAAPAEAADGRPRPATIRYRTPAGDPTDEESVGKIGALFDFTDGEAKIVSALEGGSLDEIGFTFPIRVLAVAPRADGRFVEVAGLAPDLITALLQGAVGSAVDVRIEESPHDDPRTISLHRRRLEATGDMLSLEQILAVQEQLLHGQPAPDPAPDERATSVMVLVTGESIECRIDALDDRGLRVRRPDGEAVTIPHEMVQAVELVPAGRVTLSPEKFRSLVTLPRSQRGQPPTHLVRSPAGDYLRGRVLSLDAEGLRIAVDSDPRGKPTTIPRADVARIVWLHPEVLADDWVPPRLTPPPDGLDVEAIGVAGDRIRIAADSLDGNVLSGRHAVLGPWGIDLERVERLRIGDSLDAAPLAAPYSKWQLRPAAEPRNLPPRRKAG